jgi:dienelactone hydrolase
MKQVASILMCGLFAITLVQAQGTLKELDMWLETKGTTVPHGQKFSSKPLSEEDATEAAAMIYNKKAEEIRSAYDASWERGEFSVGNYKMKLLKTLFDGQEPNGGRDLFISMHGGGGTSPEVNDQQWRNQIRLYNSPGAIFIAPRAAVNEWNMWFQPHVDTLFTQIIETLVARGEVNPDRVYLLGYSAGGDGAYRMGPRMADSWAAASMMAGHPGDASPVNLRNIGFSVWMGGEDTAYDRNKTAVEYGRILDSLQQADSGGYPHDVRILQGKGHWMDRADTMAVKWMSDFTRNPYPDRVVWRQDDPAHSSFYWLAVDAAHAKRGDEAIVECKNNRIDILVNDYTMLEICLNDRMIDYSKPVEVYYRGKRIFKGKVERTTNALLRSVALRADPRLMFSTWLTVTDNKKVRRKAATASPNSNSFRQAETKKSF